MPARPSILASPLFRPAVVVVKVGSALLVDQETGRLNRAWLETLVEDLLRLRKRGHKSSWSPREPLRSDDAISDCPRAACASTESQPAAAVGQIRLAHAYKELLERAM